jgi:hypothetical protein
MHIKGLAHTAAGVKNTPPEHAIVTIFFGRWTFSICICRMFDIMAATFPTISLIVGNYPEMICNHPHVDERIGPWKK